LNRNFPRSVFLCVRTVEALLTELKSRFRLRGGVGAAEELDAMRAALSSLTIQDVIQSGLHEFLDAVQRQLIAITNHLAADFFVQMPTSPADAGEIAAAPFMSQEATGLTTQSQTMRGAGTAP